MNGRITAAALCLLASAVLAGAAELPVEAKPTAEVRADNPLAALPSKPGAQVEKVKALGDDAWLELGSPAPDPKWGKSRGRAYSSKAAYASDLGGAFYCGTGQHGYVKPDGHYMDDLFFYDANAHRWVCLYPGADTKTLKLKLDEHGFEVTENGDANPVAYLSHAYNMVTYNTKPRGAYVYDPDKDRWSEPAAKMPALRGTASAFYHAELNAHYVYVAGDSRDDGRMLVYRYSQAKGGKPGR